jgi:hypothetical protein
MFFFDETNAASYAHLTDQQATATLLLCSLASSGLVGSWTALK